MDYLYFVVVGGLSPKNIGLVVRCKGTYDAYYITDDTNVDFDAVHIDSVKKITKEEYEMFLPRNKILYAFVSRIGV